MAATRMVATKSLIFSLIAYLPSIHNCRLVFRLRSPFTALAGSFPADGNELRGCRAGIVDHDISRLA